MSSDEHYEVIWDGSHRHSDADLLLLRPVVAPAPDLVIPGYAKPERSTKPVVYFYKGKTRTVRNGPKVEVFCLECGQQFYQRYKSEGRPLGGRKFCGKKCSGLWHRRQAAQKTPQASWRIGKTDEEIERYLRATVSRGKLRRATPRIQPCEVCGTTEKIHRHHKDHDPLNNVLTNVAWLCSEHHAQLHARERAEQPF